MTFPVRGARITAGYDQLRPLSVEKSQRTHIHGAIDLSCPIGSPILAPEPGQPYYWCAFRPALDRGMDELPNVAFPFDFAGRSYFYDTYGAMTVFLGESGLTHIFAHSFMNQLFNSTRFRLPWTYTESQRVERFPLVAFYTATGHSRPVAEGTLIAASGNAGYSTAPHVHYEMHASRHWQEFKERPNPVDYFPEVLK